MAVTVDRNFGPLPEVIELGVNDWREVGLLARSLILLRTAKGLDVDGQPFEPYSDGYRRRRQEAGLPVGIVQLNVSGAMMEQLRVVPYEDRVELTW